MKPSSIAALTLCAGAAVYGPAAAQATQSGWTLPECVASSSSHYGVNPSVLSAILKVESGFRPSAVNRNRNGTLDVGIAQINSIHFRELARYGVQPEHLLDYCVGTFVAAWHLRKQMVQFGNSWYAIGAYHSVTPHLNLAYQQRVAAVLKRWGHLHPATSSLDKGSPQ